MNSFKEIIENQEKFKDKIINFFSEELVETKKELNSIKTDDDYLIKQKNKLKNRFKKVNIKKQLFLLMMRFRLFHLSH